MYRILIAAMATISLVACNSKTTPTGTAKGGGMSAQRLAANVAVLASDSFLGRKPFTAGETKTLRFLQDKFAAAGLEPANGNSYLQEVPMVNILATASPAMQVQSAKGSFTLKAYDDYVIWTDKTDPVITLENIPIVFAGYGVVAPEYNWNDYAGLDVKGKVVMVMVNDPGFASGDPALFRGNTMTYYGRWTYKFEEAARQGAKGCLIVHNTAAASYPFAVQQNSFNTSRLQLDERGKNIPHCDMIGWVAEPTAHRLLTAAGVDTSILRQAHQRNFKPVPLNLSISTSMQVKSTYSKSYNVLGKITGSKRPDEVIVYTAHWDHLGIGKPDEKGDSIYNGAADNATGTAGLIELAHAFKAGQRPERTVIFLAVTAEEQGLWGSAYYAQNPLYPVNKTVANINMDGLNPYAAAKDIVIVGRGQSDLEDYLAEATQRAGRVVTFEKTPEAGYYYRSDHFNFAKAGIPALYTKRGIDIAGIGAREGERIEAEYRAKHYHRPSDEYNAATWTLEGAIADLQLLYEVGLRVASETVFPKWKQGSEFKAIRDKQ